MTLVSLCQLSRRNSFRSRSKRSLMSRMNGIPLIVTLLSIFSFSTVRSDPKLLDVMEPFVVTAGTEFRIRCSDVNNLEWVHPHGQSTTQHLSIDHLARFNVTMEKQVIESIIQVSNATFNDTGNYTCRQGNDTSKSVSVYVFVYDRNALLKAVKPQTHIFQKDSEAVIPCLPTHPNVEITLWKNKMKQKVVGFEVVPEKGLVVSHPNNTFDGRFVCEGKFNGTKNVTESFRLIWVADDSNVSEPIIDTGPMLDILTYSTFKLTCDFFAPEGITAQVMDWDFSVKSDRVEKKNFTPTPMRKGKVKGNSYRSEVQVTYATEEETGNYTCWVQLRYSRRNLSSSVFVQVIPRTFPAFNYTNLNNSIILEELGSNVNLTCIPFGIPEPNVTWFRNNESLHNVPGVEMGEKNMTVTILRITEDNEGNYSCRIANSEGSLTAYATLELLRPAITIGGIISAAAMGIIVCALVIILILLPVLARYIYKERKQRRDLAMLEKMLFEKGDPGCIDPDIPLTDQVELLPYDRRWEFSRDQIKLGKPIGQGAFGRVLKAKAYGLLADDKPMVVAVKLLKAPSLTKNTNCNHTMVYTKQDEDETTFLML